MKSENRSEFDHPHLAFFNDTSVNQILQKLVGGVIPHLKDTCMTIYMKNEENIGKYEIP